MALMRRRTPDQDSMTQNLNRFFEDFFGSPSWLSDAWLERESGFCPALDVSEGENEVTVETELPGLKPEDVEVTVDGQVLCVKGERKSKDEKKSGDNYYRRERRYGRFERRVALPESINPEDVKANFNDGVLTVRIGKREEKRPRSVKVEVGKGK